MQPGVHLSSPKSSVVAPEELAIILFPPFPLSVLWALFFVDLTRLFSFFDRLAKMSLAIKEDVKSPRARWNPLHPFPLDVMTDYWHCVFLWPGRHGQFQLPLTSMWKLVLVTVDFCKSSAFAIFSGANLLPSCCRRRASDAWKRDLAEMRHPELCRWFCFCRRLGRQRRLGNGGRWILPG